MVVEARSFERDLQERGIVQSAVRVHELDLNPIREEDQKRAQMVPP